MLGHKLWNKKHKQPLQHSNLKRLMVTGSAHQFLVVYCCKNWRIISSSIITLLTNSFWSSKSAEFLLLYLEFLITKQILNTGYWQILWVSFFAEHEWLMEFSQHSWGCLLTELRLKLAGFCREKFYYNVTRPAKFTRWIIGAISSVKKKFQVCMPCWYTFKIGENLCIS